jgi:hypothetical protein
MLAILKNYEVNDEPPAVGQNFDSGLVSVELFYRLIEVYLTPNRGLKDALIRLPDAGVITVVENKKP